jgi:hypothetical protein
MSKLVNTSIMLSTDQIEFCKIKSGNLSRYIRSLIDREMGQELATEKWRSVVNAYQNVLNKQKEPGEPDSGDGL